MATIEQRFQPKTPHPQAQNPIPSSSPAFATPVHPIKPHPLPRRPVFIPLPNNDTSDRVAVLPILLPATTLRPIAFRTFTKKHNLTLTSSALQALATFIGRHCGPSWREDGLAELVLEEVARSWKRAEGKLIVDGTDALKDLLKMLEGSMSGGRVVSEKSTPALSRQNSLVRGDSITTGGSLQRQDSFGISSLEVEDEEDENDEKDAKKWFKIISAYEQPRLYYNASKKHFEKSKSTATLFPAPSQKTDLFRQRYYIIHQRVLRNESFQTPSVANSNRQQWKITPIANLLGRSGSGHLLLGLLTVAPTGTLAISDLTGGIHLDLSQATPIDTVETWLCPGMIVLVDGVYEEEYNLAGGSLGNTGGIGGTIGGRFVGFSLGAPRCETRAGTLGLVTDSGHGGLSNLNVGGGFGWVDFLGTGSEKAVGARMRKVEQKLLNAPEHERINSNKVVVIGSCALDDPRTFAALRHIFSSYSNSSRISTKDAPNPSEQAQPPLAFILLGSFVTQPAMAVSAASTAATKSISRIPDSITYKEAFDALALLLSDFTLLLRSSAFVFVPGDSDPWPSAFSAGAAVPLPRQGIPDVFTSRIRRAFASANQDSRNQEDHVKGEAVWTSNPARVSLFGPSCEMVLFRDDISSRMRRQNIPLKEWEDEIDALPCSAGAEAASADQVAASEVQAEGTAAAAAAADAMDVESETAESQTQTQMRQAQSSTPAVPQIHHTSKTTAPERLTKTLLDQSHLSPFPLDIRPQHWSYAPSALSLYPLPSVLVLCDTEIEPFVLGYQGCTVLNAGAVVGGVEGVGGSWCEYDVKERKGVVRSF